MTQSEHRASNQTHSLERLLNRLDRVKDCLVQQLETEPAYSELVGILDSIDDRLKSSQRLVAKIISPASTLASRFKTASEEREALCSSYEFQTVAPTGNIRSILQHCDLICLLYLSFHEVHPYYRRLIELAQQENISLLVLVSKSINAEGAKANLSDWLAASDCIDRALVPLSEFIDLNCSAHLERIERLLIDLPLTIEANRYSKMELEIEREIKRFFARETKDTWQSIKNLREEYFAGAYIHVYQQQLQQSINQVERFKQQSIREIKQEINHAKADLLNPFKVDSLVYGIQQLIADTQVKVVQKSDRTYLYLVLSHFPDEPYLHDYVREFCRQKVEAILAWQWSQVTTVYGSGGLKSLRDRLGQELKVVEALLPVENRIISEAIILQASSFESVIEPECLEFNSRIIFDYVFTQSSWFRLFISMLIGIGIYLFTWLLFGTGKYIGFVIIIFQIINLITGQSARQAKLKQQTKELRRLVERNYQSLVRTIVAYIGQTLVENLDRQCQQDLNEWQSAISAARDKLDELKQNSDLYRARVARLKQDKEKILNLLK